MRWTNLISKLSLVPSPTIEAKDCLDCGAGKETIPKSLQKIPNSNR